MQETLERVRGILARRLNVPPEQIGEDVPLSSLGLDSLAALEVAFEIEESFHISIPDDRIPEFTTLRAACTAIEAVRVGSSTA
jgi:acyl carrier protein